MIRIIVLITTYFCLISPSKSAEFPPLPGKRVDVGGYHIHIHCLGQGQPTAIIDTGLGDDSTAWVRVLQVSAKQRRTCVYDRPGYGWSDRGPQPRNSRRIAFELDRLLTEADIAPPYILIGHSFGGFNVRLYASENPDKVAGIVLVDSSHEKQYDKLDINLPKNTRRARGIVMLSTNIKSEHADDNDKLLKDRAFHAAVNEINSLYQSSLQVERYSHIPTVPLVVVSRGLAEWKGSLYNQKKEQTWIRLQQDLSHLSPISQHIFAHHSGHDIHQQQPEIIIEAISEVEHLANLIAAE
jgi:pimeloyl-ACP methyl ester carboxylesterase